MRLYIKGRERKFAVQFIIRVNVMYLPCRCYQTACHRGVSDTGALWPKSVSQMVSQATPCRQCSGWFSHQKDPGRSGC